VHKARSGSLRDGYTSDLYQELKSWANEVKEGNGETLPTEMRIRGADKKRDNYMDATHFVFNVFKTAKFKSEEERKVLIPEELRPFLNKWK